MKILDHLNPSHRYAKVRTPELGLDATRFEFLNDKEPVTLLLRPGEYRWNGIMTPEKLSLIALEPGSVTVFVEPNLPTSRYTPQAIHRSYRGISHMMGFYAHGIIFDMQWDKWETRRKGVAGRFKLGCIALKCWQGKIENCTVRNFGADGTREPNGNEVFPMLLASYSGPEINENLPEPGIELVNCNFESPHFVDGGYSTLIHAITNHPGAGDRFPAGQRRTQAAHIHNHTIKLPGIVGPIGFGAGGDYVATERAVWEDNVFEGYCGFNADTGSLWNSTIRRCKIKASKGINITCASNSVTIEDCVIETTGPMRNQRTGVNMPEFAINLKNNAFTTIRNTTIISHLEKPIIGTYVDGGGINIVKPTERVEIESGSEECKEQIAQLKTALIEKERQLEGSVLENRLLGSKVLELTFRMENLKKDVANRDLAITELQGEITRQRERAERYQIMANQAQEILEGIV